MVFRIIYEQRHFFSPLHDVYEYLVPFKIKSVIDLVYEYKSQYPIQIFDLCYIILGFVFIFSMVHAANGIIILAQKLLSASATTSRSSNILNYLKESFKKSCVVIKVGCLLIIRIFFLPLCLGIYILSFPL